MLGESDRYYIGETAKLWRRARNYMHPGNRRTALRINGILSECVATGIVPGLHYLRFGAIQLNGQSFGPEHLENKLTRVFVEHLMISFHLLNGCHLLNAKAPEGEAED